MRQLCSIVAPCKVFDLIIDVDRLPNGMVQWKRCSNAHSSSREKRPMDRQDEPTPMCRHGGASRRVQELDRHNWGFAYEAGGTPTAISPIQNGPGRSPTRAMARSSTYLGTSTSRPSIVGSWTGHWRRRQLQRLGYKLTGLDCRRRQGTV